MGLSPGGGAGVHFLNQPDLLDKFCGDLFLKPDHSWHHLMTADLCSSDDFSGRGADDFRQPGNFDVHPTMDAAGLAVCGHGGLFAGAFWCDPKPG